MTNQTAMKQTSTAPIWLKLLGAIGIIWYAFGLMQFWLSYTMDTQATVQSGAITAAHGDALNGTPFLIWVAFAIASGAGLIGSTFLVMRNRAAAVIFLVSLVSAIIYYAWVYGISGTGGDRPSEEIIIAAVVCTVTLTYLLISRRFT